LKSKNEKAISATAFTTAGVHFFSLLLCIFIWMFNGHPTLNVKEITVYKTHDDSFMLDFYFDKITAVYLLVGSFLTFLVTSYSRYYLHREEGYKRFFNTILFFFIGYNITVMSGNFETLFLGWEILGISSFLLISFYRNRYLPVKNAIKVFSVYRIGDVGIVLAVWLSHHLWHQNITFNKLLNYNLVHEHLQNHSFVGVAISLMILVSAAAKSAQFPFSSWLPRAMEGPTPSSAIFYGSLSVHIGVFLLLRTFPFWDNQIIARVMIGLVGLVTAILATLTARVQSSVKSQIAYASISQIGLIFIELSLGFEDLALIHFAGNAFLRTYQLLVSPSVVSYLIREQFYNFVPRVHTFEDSWSKKIQYSIYILSVKEWNLDNFMFRFLWSPIKGVGKRLSFINFKTAIFIFICMFLFGVVGLYYEDHIPPTIHYALPNFIALLGMLFVMKSFAERKNVYMSLTLVMLNHFLLALAISYNEYFEKVDTLMYLSGVIFSGAVGLVCLSKLSKLVGPLNLNEYYGYSYKNQVLAFVFLLACLGMSGFPITPTFIGEDLIFSHIHEDQIVLAFLVSISFVIDGFALIRIYARLFMGPHTKRFHDVSFRSA
jgi:NADH:ubiquinone oxidoreductase subunit 5 (subunit L)/multisubunit Na+/H+ antiporter MnhA subunit